MNAQSGRQADDMVYPDSRYTPLLGIILLALGIVAGIGWHSEQDKTLPASIVIWSMTAFLLIGGIYCLCARSGITLSRGNSKLRVWFKCLWMRSQDEYDFSALSEVRIGQAKRTRSRSFGSAYIVYPVTIATREGGEVYINANISDKTDSINLAGEIGKYVNIPVRDLSGIDTGTIWFTFEGPSPGTYVPPRNNRANC